MFERDTNENYEALPFVIISETFPRSQHIDFFLAKTFMFTLISPFGKIRVILTVLDVPSLAGVPTVKTKSTQ